MHVIIAAGGTHKPDDPLYPLTRGGFKSLLEIAGKPMLQWVLDALNATARIENIYVVGLPAETQLKSAKPLTLLDGHGDMISNFLNGARYLSSQFPQETHCLACSADIPLITPVMVEWMVDQVLSEHRDLYYNVISRAVMEKRFPGSKRTYVRLRGTEYCGGDLNAVSLSAAAQDNPLWEKIVAARKSPAKQAALVGYGTLMNLLAGRLTLESAEQVVLKKLGLRARALVCPHAELGMDVDRPFQLDIAREELLKRNV